MFKKISINKLIKIISIIISFLLIIIGISSIFVTAYFNSTFYHADEKTYFKYSIGIPEILSLFISLGIIFISFKTILKKIPSNILLILLSIFSLALYIYWINTIQLNPESDQRLIHEMASALLNGNINYYLQQSQYLSLYPYQFALTVLVSIVYKIFGENYLYIQYINAICSVLNTILIFYISKLLFKNDNIQKILLVLLGGFSLYWMFFNVHFYGNIIGLSFALLAIYLTLLYLEKHKNIFLLILGISIAISILIKTNYMIFLCAIAIVIFSNLITCPKNDFSLIKKLKLFLIPILIFLLGFCGINLFYNLIVKYIYKIDLPDGVPMITYIYMGMAEPTTLSPGWYTGDNAKLYTTNNYDHNQTVDKSLELIQNRLAYFIQNPKIFIMYYLEKIGSTWLNPTFQTIWCSLPGTRYRWYEEYAHYLGYHEKALSMVGGNLYKVEENFFNIYQILIFIFASFGISKIKNNIDLKTFLLQLVFIGGFSFHILWETKAIYVLPYYFILLPYSAFAINYLFEKIEKSYKQNKILKLNKFNNIN